MSLETYIARKNVTLTFMGLAPRDLSKLDAAMAEDLFQQLDNDMSPENLTADGERPRAEVARLRKLYTAAYQELRAKGFIPKLALYSF